LREKFKKEDFRNVEPEPENYPWRLKKTVAKKDG